MTTSSLQTLGVLGLDEDLFAKCAKRSCHLFAQSLRWMVSTQLDLLFFSPSLNHQHVYRRNVLTELTAAISSGGVREGSDSAVFHWSTASRRSLI